MFRSLFVASVAANLVFADISASPASISTDSGLPATTSEIPLITKQFIKDLVTNKLTIDEKIQLLAGIEGTGYVGYIKGLEKDGSRIPIRIPDVKMNDGPQGFRVAHTDKYKTGTSTAFPSNLAMGSTFAPEIMEMYSELMAMEFKGKGANMILGPGVNLQRVPNNGRNFEYMSGEDPVLGSKMVESYIAGALNQNMMTSVKHYVNNEQETARTEMSADVPIGVDEEYYYQPFIAAVKAGASSVMCSYNKINTTYACENPETMGKLLKHSEDFFFVSDWGATHTAVKALNAGLHVEMPHGEWFTPTRIKMALRFNQVSQETIDNAVIRILNAMWRVGLLNSEQDSADSSDTSKSLDSVKSNAVVPLEVEGDLNNNVTSMANKKASMLFATEGMVLLKNSEEKIDDNANSYVDQKKGKTKNILPLKAEVKVATVGCGKELTVAGGGSGSVVPSSVETVEDALKSAGYYDADSDVVLTCLSTFSEEGVDRKNLNLDGTPPPALKEKSKDGKSDKKYIVFVSAPGPFLAPWEGNADAVLASFYPGERVGSAVTAVLYGFLSPNGKMPFTIPNKENEQGMSPEQYPGVTNEATYSEKGVFGYRWYQANDKKALYSFGHGLPYGLENVMVESKKWVKKDRELRVCANLVPDRKESSASDTATVKDLGSNADVVKAESSIFMGLRRQASEVHDHFDAISSSKPATKSTPPSVDSGRLTLQLYLKHKSRKYLELLDFRTLPTPSEHEPYCVGLNYRQPMIWDNSKGDMVATEEYELYISKTGVEVVEQVKETSNIEEEEIRDDM